MGGGRLDDLLPLPLGKGKGEYLAGLSLLKSSGANVLEDDGAWLICGVADMVLCAQGEATDPAEKRLKEKDF